MFLSSCTHGWLHFIQWSAFNGYCGTDLCLAATNPNFMFTPHTHTHTRTAASQSSCLPSLSHLYPRQCRHSIPIPFATALFARLLHALQKRLSSRGTVQFLHAWTSLLQHVSTGCTLNPHLSYQRDLHSVLT